MKEDYYSILGLKQDAEDMEIRRAYKKLAMKYHPDRNNNDKTCEEMFKKIGKAYEVLSDPDKRKMYDQYGHTEFSNNSYSYNTNHFTDLFSDIFGDVFGEKKFKNRKNESFSKKGSDSLHIIKIKLEDAAKGVTVKFKINVWTCCEKCNGSGAENLESIVGCDVCNGYGQINFQQGLISIQQMCNKCHGRGTIIKDLCVLCYGNGRMKNDKILSAKIPSGIDNNDKIKLLNEGNAGLNSSPSGDLYIQVKILKHEIFVRNGLNLSCSAPIDFITAFLGGVLLIPTLNERIKIFIPKETQTNKIFRIKHKGVKNMNKDSYGDILCRVIVETPVNFNSDQIDLLKKLKKSIQCDNIPKMSNWTEIIKKYRR